MSIRLLCLALALASASARAETPIDVGDRLEPFVDLFLVDSMKNVTHEFHKPQEITPTEQAPSDGYYATVIFLPKEKKYLHYCREVIPGYTGSNEDGNPGEATALEESTDGVHWTKPNLGLFEVNGAKDNNYVLYGMSPFSHNFSPFLDGNPACPPEERFKALAGTVKTGLVAFVSPDGIHWKKLREEAVIPTQTGKMIFDSQNVAFWSPAEKQYVAYCRLFADNLRKVIRTTSPDFLTWSEPVLQTGNLPDEQLYTSQAHPYYRAPHIVVGLATRFFPTGGQSTDIVLLTARDDKGFDRLFKEAFIRPAPLKTSWSNRGNFAALNVFPLKNTTKEDMPEEWRHRLNRDVGILVRNRVYRLRVDGFASLHAGHAEGEVVTKPLVFSGDELWLNYQTSAAGLIRVEVLDADGTPIPGFTATDFTDPYWGDEIGRTIPWKDKKKLTDLVGKPVRLKFTMREADLYSIQFLTRPK